MVEQQESECEICGEPITYAAIGVWVHHSEDLDDDHPPFPRSNKADTKAKPLTVQGLRNRKSLWPDEVPPMPADLLPDDKWHHVTFTRDEEGKEAWYVDGKATTG